MKSFTLSHAGRLSLAAATLILAQLSVSPAKADAVSVYVGYADNLRPSGFFPTPWLGGANVVSETPTGQSFDAGAIRIDNTGGTTLHITNFNVHFPSNGSNYSIWNSLDLTVGQTGIFTQTFSYNFDTSDFGIFGNFAPGNLTPGAGNLIGGCSSPAGLMTAAQVTACAAAIPVISFDLNGIPMSFSDSGHILDTGEYDFVNQSADGNESINWNLVGSNANRGGNTGVPEPGTLALFGFSLAGIGVLARRRKHA